MRAGDQAGREALPTAPDCCEPRSQESAPSADSPDRSYTMNAVAKTAASKPFSTEGDYKVADIPLADFGRREIDIAEPEMPGLMSIRQKYAPEQSLAGVRVTGSLHMNIQTAVL